MFFTGNVPRWGIWEMSFNVTLQKGNPFDVCFRAVLSKDDRKLTVFGFYDGDSPDGGAVFKLRFMPYCEGEWHYQTVCDLPELDGHTGGFMCVRPETGSHGVARVHGSHFIYDDGTPLYPIGTTCYAWIHQPEALRRQTLETLKSTRFKKIRMCVFPKHYDYNHNEPEIYPFAGGPDQFDYARPNPFFYKLLEESIFNLSRLGIEADLILFHAYDRWGFSKMDEACNLRYLRYAVARLSCFSNVWWSLANEYDLLPHLDTQAWETFAQIIREADYARHLISIHNCVEFYDHNKQWISHCSIQRQDVYKTAEYTDKWLSDYKKPVVLDETGYEGDINWGWGNLSAQELTRRAWECFVRGGYPGHGETYLSPDEVLWWSKGGALKGESHQRFGFLLKICEEAGGIALLPERCWWDLPVGGIENRVYIAYFGFNRPGFREFYSDEPRLAKNNFPKGDYRVEIIDTWNMSITDCGVMPYNKLRVELPGRQYMAVRITPV